MKFYTSEPKTNFQLVNAIICSVSILLLASCSGNGPEAYIRTATGNIKSGPVETSLDLLVYGATPGGITAAIAASRHGRSVLILEPGDRIGGIVSGGLTASDVCIHKLVGGISREFFERAGGRYGKKVSWRLEPHIAEEEFRRLLEEEDIPVRFSSKVSSADVQSSTIKSLKTYDNITFSARRFIDASYEGDLLAAASVSFNIGRESASTYGEKFAGRSKIDEKNQFPASVNPFDKNGSPLPGIASGNLSPTGAGDNMVMAYNFRPCFSKDPENQVKFRKPSGYKADTYELLARYIESRKESVKLSELLLFLSTVRNKADINSTGPFSTDMLNNSSSWAEGNWAEREKIFEEHKQYTQGLLYFLSSSPRVPERIREDMNRWGLCKDEFVETRNWPHQLYIRTGRRMVGEYVLTEHDLLTNNFKPDSIGWGTCRIELHHSQRVLKGKKVVNEGRVGYRNNPYQIPYRVITPKKTEVTNLLVPVSLSASNVAYSSIRMEPVFMILGHAAGVASHLSLKEEIPVQDVNVPVLQNILLSEKSVL